MLKIKYLFLFTFIFILFSCCFAIPDGDTPPTMLPTIQDYYDLSNIENIPEFRNDIQYFRELLNSSYILEYYDPVVRQYCVVISSSPLYWSGINPEPGVNPAFTVYRSYLFLPIPSEINKRVTYMEFQYSSTDKGWYINPSRIRSFDVDCTSLIFNSNVTYSTTFQEITDNTVVNQNIVNSNYSVYYKDGLSLVFQGPPLVTQLQAEVVEEIPGILIRLTQILIPILLVSLLIFSIIYLIKHLVRLLL